MIWPASERGATLLKMTVIMLTHDNHINNLLFVKQQTQWLQMALERVRAYLKHMHVHMSLVYKL